MHTRPLTTTVGVLAGLALALGTVSAVPAGVTETATRQGGEATTTLSTDDLILRAKPKKAKKKRKRGLRVVVKRPKEARKLVKVRVIGPKRKGRKRFRKTFRKTRLWKNARPGVYRIKAKKIDLFDQRIAPTVTRKKIRIRKNRQRKVVRVRYRKPAFCARNGTALLGWGDNQFGQLGTPGGTDSSRPIANRWLRGATAVTGGARTGYALCRDGSVWAWGFNGNGELGHGTTGDRTWPVRVKGLTNVVEIAANEQSAYALRTDGSVWAWGAGRYGQLGDGTSGFGRISRTPVRVQLPGPASTIAAGGHTAYAVLRGSGQVAVWGNGGVGQRGDGSIGESTPTPVTAAGLTGVVELAAGHVTVYARTASSGLHAWGGNNQGEIAYLGASSSNVPVPSSLIAEVIGASHSAGYATVPIADTLGWGSGRHHDIGHDNSGNPSVPVFVDGIGHRPVQSFAGAGYGGYALLRDGTVWAWGDNGQGQVGTGAPRTGPASTEGLLPAVIPGLSGVSAIGAGVVNGYAVR